ncbi:hypothetical protein [Caulobacter sp. RL271]|uniref:Uncharacterized protein n=1 Tax=Caulobacter segnis TaxID=88688 RepID=A0ABY4ZUF4_9CAUL|nr:hypothetical protein [Caulobacter segnis]USQ95652.1 hypothetical protein MZV50_24430 [Caulobacter segnis]
MKTVLRVAALCVAFLAPVSTRAQDASKFDPATIDLAKLIACRTYQPAQYNALAFWMAEDDGKAALAHLGLSETPSANPMLRTFTLKAPLTVFGRQTRQIAFASSGPLAILDEADPHPLARELGVKAAVDTPGKFLGEREISAASEKDEKTGMTFSSRVALNVSTVTSHPGKTLAGCSYVIDVLG